MSECEVCHNDYDKAFTVTMGGKVHTFDSFECAIHALAPVCHHCGCRILGHGVEAQDTMYCCASCGRHEGAANLRDRTGAMNFEAKKEWIDRRQMDREAGD